jgi:hypothetical protein
MQVKPLGFEPSEGGEASVLSYSVYDALAVPSGGKVSSLFLSLSVSSFSVSQK